MAAIIAQISDLHLNDTGVIYRARSQQAVIMDITEDAYKNGARLMILAGDIVGMDAPHKMSTSELNLLASIIDEIKLWMPVVVLKGNHDREYDLDLLQWRESALLRHNCNAANIHRCFIITGFSFPLEISISGIALKLGFLPYMSKYAMAANSPSSVPVDGTIVAEPALRFLLDRNIDLLFSHLPVQGARAGKFVVPNGRDIILRPESLDPFPYVGLGHFHDYQQVAKNAYYSGAPYPLVTGDDPNRGYILIKADRDQNGKMVVEHEFRPVRSWAITGIDIYRSLSGELHVTYCDPNIKACINTPMHIKCSIHTPDRTYIPNGEISGYVGILLGMKDLSATIDEQVVYTEIERNHEEKYVEDTATSVPDRIAGCINASGLTEADKARIAGCLGRILANR